MLFFGFLCFIRHQDLTTKKQHLPSVDRTPLEPPPIVVAVVGPPKVGKTTLIRCLIKNFTRQPLSNIKGPVTVVSGNVFQYTSKIICFTSIIMNMLCLRKT